MNDETYQCSNCGGVFLKDWSDEEAQAEYEANFPIGSTIPGDAMIVCDDCYNAMIEWKPPAQFEAEQYGEGARDN